MSKDPESDPAPAATGYSLVRLERVADIVFGVALLLLVVKIDFAPRDSSSAADAYAFLWKGVSQSFGFIINFLLVAFYWLSHQEYFRHYKRTNKTHTFLELLFLLAIAGMPVNNDFIEAFPAALAPRLAISSDIVFAGLFLFLSWSYAVSGNRLVDAKAMTPELARYMRWQALVLPAVAIIGAGAALLHPLAWDAVLFVGPILGIALIKSRGKRG
jgi:uncharacterized membrane protein